MGGIIGGGGGGGGGDGGAADAARREAQRQANITQGTASIDSALSKFNPDYYSGIENSYIQMANPQLDDSYSNAKKQLVYALSRTGNLNSNTAVEMQRKLEAELEKNRRDIINAARGYSSRAKSDIANTRTDLLSQLTATENPSAVANQAMLRAEQASQMPAFDPIGNFTFNTLNELQNQSNAQTGYRGYVNSPKATSATGSNGSVSYRG